MEAGARGHGGRSGAVLGDITNIINSRDAIAEDVSMGRFGLHGGSKTWMQSVWPPMVMHAGTSDYIANDDWEELELTTLPDVESAKWENSDDNSCAWHDLPEQGSTIMDIADMSSDLIVSPFPPEEPPVEAILEEEEEDLDIIWDLEEELSRQLGQSLEFDLQDEQHRDVLNDIIGTPRTPSPRACRPVFSTSAAHDGPETDELKPLREQQNQQPQSTKVEAVDDKGHCDARLEQVVSPAADYVPDLLRRMLAREAASLPTHDFLEAQNEVDANSRRQVVDMLVQVHFRTGLQPETLFLAVSTLDRYLSRAQVAQANLHLAGIACLIAAAKFQEAGVPMQAFHSAEKEVLCPAARILGLVGTKAARKELMEVECDVLQAVGFDMAVPTAATFVAHFGSCSTFEAKQMNLAHYLLELALYDEGIWTVHTPSKLALASLVVAAELTGCRAPWPSSMDARAGAAEVGLAHCANWLRMFLASASSSGCNSVQRKYSLPQFCGVAEGFSLPA